MMPTDDESVPNSDPRTTAHDRTSGENGSSNLWQRFKMAWQRSAIAEALPRLALHFGFIPVVLAGLILARSICERGVSRAAPPSSQPSAASLSPETLYNGTGGEMADSLLAAIVPHTTIPRRYRIDPITYTVGPGDSAYSIADKFEVSMETILWANGTLEDNPDFLADGDVLTILPVSGVYHTVVKGDTLESIAEKYKAQVDDIIHYEGNYMQEPYTITPGQKLIVPGGRKPYQVRRVVAWDGPIPTDAKRGSGSFGWPMSGFISTSYDQYHHGIDIAGPKGTPIKASDSGYVALVGRNDTSYGLYVLLDHGNGYQTLYGHFSAILVEVGQSVAKGQTIGLCGSTGKSTGPHVHFEIRLNGAYRNPMLFLK